MQHTAAGFLCSTVILAIARPGLCEAALPHQPASPSLHRLESQPVTGKCTQQHAAQTRPHPHFIWHAPSPAASTTTQGRQRVTAMLTRPQALQPARHLAKHAVDKPDVSVMPRAPSCWMYGPHLAAHCWLALEAQRAGGKREVHPSQLKQPLSWDRAGIFSRACQWNGTRRPCSCLIALAASCALDMARAAGSKRGSR